ncbi:hypothetical protein [Streptomyces anandii]|uniref:hypothetical protein n=1 Tax=Streptomyces anandii TaxID=285454 RepID=UPI0036B046E0
MPSPQRPREQAAPAATPSSACPGRDRTDFRGYAGGSYWSVPMPSAATLCAPLAVARLVAAHRLAADSAQTSKATRVSATDHS